MPTIYPGRGGTRLQAETQQTRKIHLSSEVINYQLSGILGHKSKLFL